MSNSKVGDKSISMEVDISIWKNDEKIIQMKPDENFNMKVKSLKEKKQKKSNGKKEVKGKVTQKAQNSKTTNIISEDFKEDINDTDELVIPKKIDSINMHFNKNDLNAINHHHNHHGNYLQQPSFNNKVCFTDTDDHYTSESNFDKAKKAFFTPEKGNNPKLTGTMYYPKQNNQGEMFMENAFISKFNSHGQRQSNLNKEYDMLGANSNYSVPYDAEQFDENKTVKKPYVYNAENTNYLLQQKMKSI